MTIYKDRAGRLWLGTYGGGLNMFDREKRIFFKYSEKSGLYSDVVYGIIEDDNSNLWLSTDNGIFKFDYHNETFIQYDVQDGLQSMEFSGGAYTKSRSGYFYFGGVKGVNYFHPDSMEHNLFIPPLVLSSFKVFDEDYPININRIELEFDQNFFSFEFSALDFSNPVKNNYAYILEGLDKDWQFVDASRRIATYTNVPPGDYIFRVIGSNNDNIWNTDGLSVSLVIYPPFWSTWWFISIVVLISAFLIYYIGTIRYKNLLAIERLKSRLAADLHDNIGSGLTEISILSELSTRLESADQKNQHLDNISDKARELVDNMSDIVWMVNPQKDSFHELILRLKQNYDELLMNMGINFKAKNIESFKDYKLPMELKQNLFLILKEGLNNAIKHSKCRNIVLESSVLNNHIEIKLFDDGIGLPDSYESMGNGVKNIIRRSKEIGGKISFYENPKGGTVLHFAGTLTKKQFLASLISKKAKNKYSGGV
jgi:signal transduction histidine kinase